MHITYTYIHVSFSYWPNNGFSWLGRGANLACFSCEFQSSETRLLESVGVIILGEYFPKYAKMKSTSRCKFQ